MIPREYGQYSLISYVNQLRGERLNLGVAVWHPRMGFRFNRTSGLKRVACIDAGVDLRRLERHLKLIRKILEDWTNPEASPLTELAAQFRHDLVVSSPLNARVTDLDFLCERLSAQLMPPVKSRQLGRV